MTMTSCPTPASTAARDSARKAAASELRLMSHHLTTSGASVMAGMRSSMMGHVMPLRRSRKMLSSRDSPIPATPPLSMA